MKVLVTSEVQAYMNRLVKILYEMGYFPFEHTAQKYVKELYDDIKINLPSKRHKPAPPYYNRYGKGLYYAVFKKNRRTSYYAFFSKYNDSGQTIYLVCYIGNNHTDAQHL